MMMKPSWGYNKEPYALYQKYDQKKRPRSFIYWSYAKTLEDCPQYYYTSNDPELQKKTVQDQNQFYQEMK